MSGKRKRGANYTPQETEKLLELVKQHRLAIEDKRSGYVHLSRKKEAWDKVCAAYNAVATSGTRSVDQLRVFYDNKKQKARKSLATHNEQYNKTGGGSWHPAVTDHDLKFLSLVSDQITPLPNSDSAAVFFGDLSKQIADESDHKMDSAGNEINEIDTHRTKITAHPYKKKGASLYKNNGVSPCKKKGQVYYKTLYFKRKSQNALLERRRLYQEIRLKQKEHSLVVKEHELRMQFLKEEHDKRMQEMA